MQAEYSEHVQDVLVHDLDNYMTVTYDDQISKLPERLLKAICGYHRRSFAGRRIEKMSARRVGVGAVDEVS